MHLVFTGCMEGGAEGWMRLEKAHTSVPSQDGVGQVRTHLLGSSVKGERMLEPGHRAVRFAPLEVRLRRALPCHTEVIDALVFVRQALERCKRLLEQARAPGGESVGKGEAEQLPRRLMSPVDVEHVAANALGLL